MRIFAAATMGMMAIALAACASPQRMSRTDPNSLNELSQNILLMKSHDANADGTILRDEMEKGLAVQFADCDSNDDGHLSLGEMQAENDRRWRANGVGFSPLIDWNRDGIVDMPEFATTARSIFNDLDRDQNGALDSAELRVPVRRGRGAGAGPIPPR